MKSRRRLLRILVILLFFCFLGAAGIYIYFGRQVNFQGSLGSGQVGDITVPPGFVVNVFAEGLQGPRFLAFGPDGVLYAADRGNNRIVALPDADRDGTADSIREFAAGLNSPHSLVYHQDAWYVGVANGVVRLQDRDGDGQAEVQTPLIDNIPTSGVHRTRTVEFLPDGRLVLSVGSSCNVCEEGDPRRAAVLVYDSPDTTGEHLYATGLRNAVGLAIHPETGELWATNNGRDLMGDDIPPDTIHILRQGYDGGWPYCHSGRIVDPNMGFEGACQDKEPPLVDLQAHSAPLGLVFYPATDDNFPQAYRGDLFVALHGSWNRSIPTGYKVIRVPLEGSQPAGPVEDFAVGWLDESSGQASGRPVGLAVGPEGALYISDDKGGFIYRIHYQGAG